MQHHYAEWGLSARRRFGMRRRRVRVTQARRAVVYRYKEFLRFLWIAEDHDATYPKGKKR
jgi:hypothetical protein